MLQNGDEMLVLSSWRTARDVRAYMQSALAQETLTRLAPLLVCTPTVKTFPIHLSRGEESFEELFVLCRKDGEADQPALI